MCSLFGREEQLVQGTVRFRNLFLFKLHDILLICIIPFSRRENYKMIFQNYIHKLGDNKNNKNDILIYNKKKKKKKWHLIESPVKVTTI